MVAITLASHLRVYGVSVPHPPPPQPSNWTRGRTTHSPSARAGPPWRSRCPCAPTTGRRRCCRCPRTNTDQQPTTATLGRPVMYYYQDYDGSGKMLMFSFLWIVVAEARCVLVTTGGGSTTLNVATAGGAARDRGPHSCSLSM
jgi:hypothetical protein